MRRDRNIPLGRFISGIFISSAIAATFVTPAYDTKTIEVASKIPDRLKRDSGKSF